ncbi:DUF4782 domain-containing protein [archaeon]|nr:MAG: DUF4782 domain-containing protein [archaeon]
MAFISCIYNISIFFVHLFVCSDFLRDEGAQDLKYTEWALNGSGNSASSSNVEEDTHLKLQYSFCREFVYAFPRTTMLMFGPKLAPIKQCHYLYLTREGACARTLDDLETATLKRAVVMFVTKFDGIPMADVFKVLQYWVLEERGNGVYMQIGVAIHYVKSTMFKSQILSGTKEEVGMLLKRYEAYAALRASEFVKAEQQQQQRGDDCSADKNVVTKRRQSYRRPSLDNQTASSLVSSGTSPILSEAKVQTHVNVPDNLSKASVSFAQLLEPPYVYVVGGALLICLLLLIMHLRTLYRLAAVDAKLNDLTRDIHRVLKAVENSGGQV